MSYSTWHIYGYGICVDHIKGCSVERLENLLSMAPEYQKDLHEWLEECEITDPSYEDYLEFDQDYNLGLATILKEVIREAEQIELTACDDFDCRKYLVYEAGYPWYFNKAKVLPTEEAAEELFRKYISVLTDDPIIIEYQGVENGG